LVGKIVNGSSGESVEIVEEKPVQTYNVAYQKRLKYRGFEIHITGEDELQDNGVRLGGVWNMTVTKMGPSDFAERIIITTGICESRREMFAVTRRLKLDISRLLIKTP